MPQTPTGITLGAYLANPSLLQQQAAAQKQAMLAKLLANYQPSAITNPNPTGAFLQNLTASLTPALGAYLAGKSLDTESKLQENQLAAQVANARALFGLPTGAQPPAGSLTDGGSPSLPGPVVVSPEMKLPASAWNPTAANPENDQGRQLLATALAGVTPPTAATESANAPLAAAAKALNLTPEQAYTWYINDKESFMKSAGEALQPTPRQKEYAGWGISNPEAAAFERAEREKTAMQSYGPNTYVTGLGRSYITPSASGEGVQHILTDKGVVAVPIEGSAAANAAYQYQQALGRGYAGMATTPAIVQGPGGKQIATTQTGAQGQVVGTSPLGKEWDDKYKIYRWTPTGELVGRAAEPGPGATTAATEQAKTGAQIPQLQNKEFIEKTLPTVRTAADDALSTLNEVGILRNSPVATGPLTEQMKLPFAKLMAALHIDPGPLTDYQQFTSAIATRLYDIARDPTIRGQQTEGDAARFRNTLPSLENTPQANAFIADYMQANAMRLMRRQQFYDQALAIKREAGATDLDDINRAWKEIDKSIWDYPIMQPWIKRK